MLQEWVAASRFPAYIKALQEWGNTVPAALQGVVEASVPDDEPAENFVTAVEVEDAGSEEPELQQLLQECDEMCGNSIWQGVVMQLLKDVYKWSRTWADGTMKLKRIVMLLGSKQDAESGNEFSGLHSFKLYYDKVQGQLQELFAAGLLSKAGFVGKSKGALLDIAPVLHIIDHFLQNPMYAPDAEMADLPRSSPPRLVKQEMVQAAVGMVEMCIEQLIVYSSEYSCLAYTSVFQHLQAAVASGGHAVPVGSSSGGFAAVDKADKEVCKVAKKLLTGKWVKGQVEVSVTDLVNRGKWVKGQVEVSVTDLVNKKHVYKNTNDALSAFSLLSSGTGGAPKLGTVEERDVAGKKVKYFVKPDSVAAVEELAAKLRAVEVALDDYLPVAKMAALCKRHIFVVPGYEAGDESPVSAAGSAATEARCVCQGGGM
ncbi:hypothetical protein OEZ85_010597 [Tetradesmus obliquus]|uniref:Uncharacterized protein n=1 Tax=Tetradesmus obliquus TaxID=3088 RepID=A0ABY8TMT5_TETOB|nr:hypothetical protein OEZ85_010597 [Tetradesmus obliquus]